MAFGVTPEGFVLKRFEDFRTEIVDSLRDKFGNIRTDSESKFGMFADILSSKFADLFAALQDVYHARSITAEGTALDDIVYWTGIQRLPASKSGLYVVMYGDIGTSVIPGTIIRCAETGNQFVLDSSESIQISSNSLGDCQISIVYADETEYSLSIDKTYNYTSPANGTVQNVVDAFVTLINSGLSVFGSEVAYAVDNGDGTFNIRPKDPTDTTVTIALNTENLSFKKIGTSMPFIAQEYGPKAAPIGDASQIVTPISGLDECYNFEPAVLGREEETDTELRTRFLQTRSALGYATVDAIANRIKQEVSGVVDVVVYENSTDTIDSEGLPPHSVMVVVDCPTPIEQAVAEKIWQVKAAGIITHGSESKTVQDSQGYLHTVNYSKIATTYAHVSVMVTVSNEKAFPSNGIAQIQAAVLKFGQSLEMGDDLIFQSFYRPVYSVQGIASVTLQLAVTDNAGDTPDYGTDNIEVSRTTKVNFDLSRIHVSLA